MPPAVEFLDEGNFGLGQLSVPAVPGREVPANAVTLSPLLPDAQSESFGRVLHDRIYLYERDAGLLAYYRQESATVQARATELVIGFLASAGNYAYGLNWVFKQDGAFVNAFYDWRIAAEKPLLRRLTWLLRPAFSANHRWAMRKGEESMRLEIERRRRPAGEAANLAAPPGPTFAWLGRRRGATRIP